MRKFSALRYIFSKKYRQELKKEVEAMAEEYAVILEGKMCPYCKKETVPGQDRCPFCHHLIWRHCPHCGKRVLNKGGLCMKCGGKFPEVPG